MRSITVLAGIAGMTIASAANAQSVVFDGWNFTVALGNGDSVWNAADHPELSQITQIGGGQGDTAARYRITGSFTMPNQFAVQWDLEMDPDPFISSFFTVQNLTGSLQPFTITSTLPTIVVGSPSTMIGSTTGTVGDGDGLIDQFGNGATIRTLVAAPYYEALVDGVGVQQLYPSAQVNSALQFSVNPIALQNFGPSAGPGVASNIGIRNRFELTPGDNASFTSTFNIVPTPGGVALLGMAGIVAGRRRR